MYKSSFLSKVVVYQLRIDTSETVMRQLKAAKALLAIMPLVSIRALQLLPFKELHLFFTILLLKLSHNLFLI